MGNPFPPMKQRKNLKSLVSGGKAIGIGSPRASLEANFALRTLVGKDRFFAGVADDQWRMITAMVGILQNGPARSPSLHDIELSDAVLILGEDVTNSSPRMALNLRQSVRQQPFEIAGKLHIPLWMDDAVREAVQGVKGPLFIAAPGPTRLDDVATRTYRAAPEDVARLGFAVAHEVDPAAPEVSDLADETPGSRTDHCRRIEEREAACGDFRAELPDRVRDSMRGECSEGVMRYRASRRPGLYRARVQQFWSGAYGSPPAQRGLPRGPKPVMPKL